MHREDRVHPSPRGGAPFTHGARRRRYVQSNGYCGCCGRAMMDGNIWWCEDCKLHILPVDMGPFEERTYFAQHGLPCPFQVDSHS
jgi:hypothetical protein